MQRNDFSFNVTCMLASLFSSPLSPTAPAASSPLWWLNYCWLSNNKVWAAVASIAWPRWRQPRTADFTMMDHPDPVLSLPAALPSWPSLSLVLSPHPPQHPIFFLSYPSAKACKETELESCVLWLYTLLVHINQIMLNQIYTNFSCALCITQLCYWLHILRTTVYILNTI